MKTHALTSTTATVLLLAMAGTALAAENDFQLPRECRERQNVDPEKCVIQDGPPRAPWVHKVTRPKAQNTSAPVASPAPASGQTSTSVRPAPQR